MSGAAVKYKVTKIKTDIKRPLKTLERAASVLRRALKPDGNLSYVLFWFIFDQISFWNLKLSS